MQTVDLGSVRLHVLTVHPGLPGESPRAARAVQGLDPAVVLADLDTDDALRLRAFLGAPQARKARFEPGFVDALYAEEVRRRFVPDADPHEHPLVGAARSARDRRIDFVPLRPLAKAPGWFARRRARAAVTSAHAARHDEWPAAFGAALADARAWDPAQEAAAMRARIEHALQGRAPVLAVVQAHRAEAFFAQARTMERMVV